MKRVRVAAAESMPLLLECARVRGPEYLTQMWHFMCDALIKAIGTEPDSDVLSEIMHSFAKVTFFLMDFVALLFVAFYGKKGRGLCSFKWLEEMQDFLYTSFGLTINVVIAD